MCAHGVMSARAILSTTQYILELMKRGWSKDIGGCTYIVAAQDADDFSAAV